MFAADCLDGTMSAVRLFGSLARGDADCDSDRDVLVLVHGSRMSRAVQESVDRWRQEAYDVSVYTEDRYRQMHGEGNLFTWHIFQESKALDFKLRPTDAPDLIDVLGVPSPYRDSCVDGGVLFSLLKESVNSLAEETCSEVYEAGVLYVIARNLAIIASWQLGDLCFSVHAPYVVGVRSGIPFPLSLPIYELFRCSRKASAGMLPPPALSRDLLSASAGVVVNWSSDLHTIIYGEQNVEEVHRKSSS